MAFTALLMAYYRQSKRRTAEFLEHAAWVSRALPALTVKMQNQVTAAARPAYEELAAATADARARQRRRNGDQGRKRQGLAVDVRGPACSRCSRCVPRARRRRSTSC